MTLTGDTHGTLLTDLSYRYESTLLLSFMPEVKSNRSLPNPKAKGTRGKISTVFLQERLSCKNVCTVVFIAGGVQAVRGRAWLGQRHNRAISSGFRKFRLLPCPRPHTWSPC